MFTNKTLSLHAHNSYKFFIIIICTSVHFDIKRAKLIIYRTDQGKKSRSTLYKILQYKAYKCESKVII